MIPEKVTMVNIPLYRPEMNQIEQLRRELRTKEFKNKVFQTLKKSFRH